MQRSGGESVGGAVGGPELVLKGGRERGRKGSQKKMVIVSRWQGLWLLLGVAWEAIALCL